MQAKHEIMLRRATIIIFFCLLFSGTSGAGSNSRSVYGQVSEQNKPAASAQERAMLKPQTLSPYLIEWLLDINEDADLKQIWRMLKLEISGDVPSRCRGDCNTETFDIDTGSEQGKTVALKIAFESADFYQYLIFRKAQPGSSEEWKFIGNIDSTNQRYGSPQHRIESGDNRTWLVIRELWGRGSGLVAYGEVWNEIKDTGVKEVLMYPVQGENTPCPNHLGRSYKSLLLRHDLENGVYTVPIQFMVSYNISECSKPGNSLDLFTKGQKAFFVWDGGKEQFVLDKTRSDITETEISSVYNMEGLSREKFIEFNFNELLEIAKTGGLDQKEWLRKFLTEAPDTRQKLALQKAFERQTR